jgi:hypothetical protein
MVTHEQWLRNKERMKKNPEFRQKYLEYSRIKSAEVLARIKADPERYEHMKQRQEAWRQRRMKEPEYKAKIRRNQRERNVRQRLQAIAHYSNGTMSCGCCGEKADKFLTLDHVNGGGMKHRKEPGFKTLSNWLVRHNYPPGYQVLCFNCNCGRALNKGLCPHKEAR